MLARSTCNKRPSYVPKAAARPTTARMSKMANCILVSMAPFLRSCTKSTSRTQAKEPGSQKARDCSALEDSAIKDMLEDEYDQEKTQERRHMLKGAFLKMKAWYLSAECVDLRAKYGADTLSLIHISEPTRPY